MKASYNWIRALVPGLTASPKELAERLTRAGVAVDAVHEFGAGTADIVIAEVKKVEPHPSRAKLRLVTIDRGGQEQRVVCGASNVPDPGGLVCLAPLGTTLPAVGMTLTPREIGGVVSEGMLCSETELGLLLKSASASGASVAAKSHDEDGGILVFAPGAVKPGTPLRQAFPSVHDFIFELDLTPNRPDALGHLGLAREAAALYALPFSPPEPAAPRRVAPEDTTLAKLVSVTIDDTERCPHYGAAAVLDVTVGPSPMWLRHRLESLGVRSISNVVDVTNLILLEFGHPMHAFDMEFVRGSKIGVRRAKPDEVMTTLDGIERKLSDDDLVVTDGEGPVALAGIMGGANSEIRATTKRVLLECAYFTPRGVRRSSRRHAIHTESSHRFERGVDPADVPDVLAHAASLLTQLAGGAAVRGSLVAGVPVSPPTTIVLRKARMRSLLGIDVPMAEAAAILERLGCQVIAREDAEVIAPTFRPDLTMEADLIEEVLRIRGLDGVPTVIPAIKPQPVRNLPVMDARVRRAALEVGLAEAVTYGFVAARELEDLGAPKPTVKLLNPLTEERSVMRTSLLPGLLEALRRARRHGVGEVRLFTLGARFLAATEATRPLPDEAPSFAAILAGHRTAVLSKPEPLDVFDAKGLAVEIVERAIHRTATVRHFAADQRPAHLHPRAAAELLVGDVRVGAFGPLHPEVVDAFDLGGPALVLELDLRALEAIGLITPKYKPIPTLPASTRDIALVVSDAISAGEVGAAIREAGEAICESVELFDLFRGERIGEGHRSLAFHVVYRDPRAATDPEKAKTLTDDEVDKRHKAVVEAVHKRFGAVLRG